MAEQLVLEKKEIQEIIALTTRSKEFKEIHDRAISHIRNIAQGFMALGQDLKEIQDNKFYEIGGFDDVYQYAEKCLGLKKTSVVNYIAVYDSFGKLDDLRSTYGTPKLSFTQLVELVPVADKPELIKEIKPGTPIKEIRAKKAISKLSEYDQRLEKMLMDDFKQVFFDELQGKYKIPWNAVYEPKHTIKREYSEDTIPNQLVIAMTGCKITIQRNLIIRDSKDGLFVYWFDRNEYNKTAFSSIEDLRKSLKDGQIHQHIKNANVDFENKEKEAKAKVEAKKIAKEKGEPLPVVTRLFKNDEQRRAYVKDMAHWKPIGEFDLGTGRKVRYFTFDLNGNFMLQQFNDLSLNMFEWTNDNRACLSYSYGYVDQVADWLKEQKL